MSHEQYDVSEEMLRLFKIKQKQRQEAKAYYQRIITNPHRPIDAGVPFDPVLFRFNAAGPYQVHHFKPNAKNFWYLLSLTIIPLYVLHTSFGWERKNREKLISTGQISYKDRMFKLIY